MSTKQTYHIWSLEHQAWWKQASRGYTRQIEEAGIFGPSMAHTIVQDANAYGKINECMVPVVDRERFEYDDLPVNTV